MSSEPRFYLIGTKYSGVEDMLPLMLENGVISTGFIDEFDLGHLMGKGSEEISAQLNELIPNDKTDAKSTLRRFLQLRPGDLVALKSHSAPNRKSPRLVIARYAVVRGNRKAKYHLLDRLGHSVEVDFLAEQELIELPYGYGKTLHHIERQDRVEGIFGQLALIARSLQGPDFQISDKSTHTSNVDGRGAYTMTRFHNELQNVFRRRLVELYGRGQVAQEADYVDLLVSLPDKYIVVEVKASMSPTSCMREALGQVLQYAWRLPVDGRRISYLVAGPGRLASKDNEFLSFIQRSTGLDINYSSVHEHP